MLLVVTVLTVVAELVGSVPEEEVVKLAPVGVTEPLTEFVVVVILMLLEVEVIDSELDVVVPTGSPEDVELALVVVPTTFDDPLLDVVMLPAGELPLELCVVAETAEELLVVTVDPIVVCIPLDVVLAPSDAEVVTEDIIEMLFVVLDVDTDWVELILVLDPGVVDTAFSVDFEDDVVETEVLILELGVVETVFSVDFEDVVVETALLVLELDVLTWNLQHESLPHQNPYFCWRGGLDRECSL